MKVESAVVNYDIPDKLEFRRENKEERLCDKSLSATVK